MSKVRYYTEEGLKKLKDELEHLMKVERPSISQQIAEARDKGDLSENAEYDAAKNAQGMLELKIRYFKSLNFVEGEDQKSSKQCGDDLYFGS